MNVQQASEATTGQSAGEVLAIDAGFLIAGRYRLVESIASGGMARVFRARDEVLERDVAVKLLDADAGAAPLDEARAAAALSHPNVAGLYDVGSLPESGIRYLVLELVEGPTLRDLLRSKGPLPARQAAEICAQVADGLHAAHQRGIVHCDVKPQNVVVQPDGQAKLLDFGIARRPGTGDHSPDGFVHGSAAYIAPEQARGEAVDGRADVFALGAVLYELLTGQIPFDGATATEVVVQRLERDAPAPSALTPGIPPALETVVMRALARAPERRYPTAAAFADDLREAASGSTEVLPLATPAPLSGVAAWSWASHRIRPLAVGAVAVLALALGLIGLAAARPTGSDAVPITPAPTAPRAAATATPVPSGGQKPPVQPADEDDDDDDEKEKGRGRGGERKKPG